MPLAEPSKNVWITIDELEAWTTFLKVHSFPLAKNPKPSEIIRGLWQYCNMLAQAPPPQPAIQGTVQPQSLPLQDTMPKPPEVVNSRFGPEAFKGFHESKSTQIIKKQALMYWAKANNLGQVELD